MNVFSKLQQMKILLVDDDEWIRDSMQLFFESEGCHLLALETAEEGIASLEKQACDIIISDYRLPGMDGIEFFKKIRNSSQASKKILITAYGSAGVVSKAKKAGVHEFIEKPFTTDTIESSLLRLLTIKDHQPAMRIRKGGRDY